MVFLFPPFLPPVGQKQQLWCQKGPRGRSSLFRRRLEACSFLSSSEMERIEPPLLPGPGYAITPGRRQGTGTFTSNQDYLGRLPEREPGPPSRQDRAAVIATAGYSPLPTTGRACVGLLLEPVRGRR